MNKSILPWIFGSIVAVLVVTGVVGALVVLTQPQQPAVGTDDGGFVLLPTRSAATAAPEPEVTNLPESTATPVPSAPTARSAITAPTATAPTRIESPTIAPTIAATPAAIQPIRVSASNTAPPSVDDQGRTITYNPENIIDGDTTTAWRVPGDGISERVRLEFAQPVRVSEIQFIPGYAKTDESSGVDRFLQNRRIVRVQFVFSGGEQLEAQFQDAPIFQPVVVDDIETTSIDMIILGTTPPGERDGRDFTPASEIIVSGISYE